MKVLAVYSRLYAQAMLDALSAIRKSAWTLLWPVGLILISVQLRILLAPLELIGGLLWWLATVALISGYLYFLGELVQKSKVSLAELKRSLGAYFSAVLSLGFVLWIFSLVLGFALRGIPNGDTLAQIISLLLVILLSAAPEVIYQRHTHGGIATVQGSIQFLQTNWLEWLVPNLPLFAAWYLLPRVGAGLGLLPQLLMLAAVGALLHVAFVFRGFVFKALDRSSHRQRMFNYRNA